MFSLRCHRRCPCRHDSRRTARAYGREESDWIDRLVERCRVDDAVVLALLLAPPVQEMSAGEHLGQTCATSPWTRRVRQRGNRPARQHRLQRPDEQAEQDAVIEAFTQSHVFVREWHERRWGPPVASMRCSFPLAAKAMSLPSSDQDREIACSLPGRTVAFVPSRGVNQSELPFTIALFARVLPSGDSATWAKD